LPNRNSDLYYTEKANPIRFAFLFEYICKLLIYFCYEKLKTLYSAGSAGKKYKNNLYAIVNQLRTKYNLYGNYSKQIKEKINYGQKTLSDDM